MFRAIRNLSISKRLQIISFVSISFICILITLIFYTKRKEEQVTDTVRIFDSMTLDVWMRIKTYNSLRGDFLTILITDPLTQGESHQEAVEFFNERLEDLASYEEAAEYWGVIPADIKANYDSMNMAVDQYVSFCKDKLPLATEVSRRDSADFTNLRKTIVVESNELYKNIRYSALNTLNAIYDNTERNEVRIESEIHTMMLLFYILSGTLIVTIFFTIRIIAKSILTPIHETRMSLELLSKGGLPAIKAYQGKDELSVMLNSLKGFSEQMTNLLSFVSNVARKNFKEEAKMFEGKGLIAEALINMRDSLKQHAVDESLRNWTIQGQADLGNMMRQQQTLDKFCDHALSYIVKYVGASHGALYIAEKNGDREHLKLASVYAYDRKKFISGLVQPGEGLAGQVYLERQSIMLHEMPDDYIKITSGLGEALPQSLIVCPLLLNDRVHGVLEIASFKMFKSNDTELIQKFAEQLASAVANGQSNGNTEELLRESQLKTEAMIAREEETARYIDELRDVQRGLEIKLNESIKQKNEFQSILRAIGQNIIVVDKNLMVQNVVQYNDYTMRKLFDKPVVAGQNLLILSDSSMHETLKNILNAAILQGETGGVTVNNVKIVSQPFRNETDNIVSYIITIDEESI
jgi:hypothetical protein